MKKQVGLMLIIVNYCLVLNSYAMTAIPLGEINHNSGGGFAIIASGPEFLWEAGESPVGGNGMFWDVVTPFDVGKTFLNSSAISENFDFFASMLTSGTDDFLWIEACCAGKGTFESRWLNKFVPTPTVDFYGYEITEIGLTVNALTIDSPGWNPNGDGVWTDYTYDVTFTIYGVPEPTTVLSLGLGGLALLRRWRG
jgi:hypothetical protein